MYGQWNLSLLPLLSSLSLSLSLSLLLSLSLSLSEVIVPSQPVVSLVGEDVILPCHLDPVMNAFDMTVEWARPDLNPRFIWLASRGRTSVFIDELEKGNISLKLSKVKVSDEGGYKCFLPALSKTSTVQLVVGKRTCFYDYLINVHAAVVDLLSTSLFQVNISHSLFNDVIIKINSKYKQYLLLFQIISLWSLLPVLPVLPVLLVLMLLSVL
uniref:Ig-like domain-containing protein n=1 Tax=Labrus bergylta TaxID=56723 RepID=A0A3Q3DZL9_9LABR